MSVRVRPSTDTSAAAAAGSTPIRPDYQPGRVFIFAGYYSTIENAPRQGALALAPGPAHENFRSLLPDF